MKKILPLLLSITLFASCAEEMLTYEIGDSKSQRSGGSQGTKAGGDGDLDCLGYGYDLNGNYFHPASAKNKVIDVVRYRSEDASRIEPTIYHNVVDFHYFAEINSQSYIKSMNAHAGIGTSWFIASLSANYNQTVTKETSNGFCFVYIYVLTKNLRIMNDVGSLKDYLTPSFTAHLESQTPDWIIDNYGTHVLTNIDLGGRLNVHYKSQSTKNSSDRGAEIKAGFSNVVTKLTGLNIGLGTSSSLVKKNQSQEIKWNTYGGNPSNSLISGISLGGDQLPSLQLDLASWQTGVTAANSNMIDARDCLPIDHLIGAYFGENVNAPDLVTQNGELYCWTNIPSTKAYIIRKKIYERRQMLKNQYLNETIQENGPYNFFGIKLINTPFSYTSPLFFRIFPDPMGSIQSYHWAVRDIGHTPLPVEQDLGGASVIFPYEDNFIVTAVSKTYPQFSREAIYDTRLRMDISPESTTYKSHTDYTIAVKPWSFDQLPPADIQLLDPQGAQVEFTTLGHGEIKARFRTEGNYVLRVNVHNTIISRDFNIAVRCQSCYPRVCTCCPDCGRQECTCNLEITVCRGTACNQKGGAAVHAELERLVAENGPSGWQIVPCRCIGACGLAPVITVAEDLYAKLTVSQISGIYEQARQKYW